MEDILCYEVNHGIPAKIQNSTRQEPATEDDIISDCGQMDARELRIPRKLPNTPSGKFLLNFRSSLLPNL